MSPSASSEILSISLRPPTPRSFTTKRTDGAFPNSRRHSPRCERVSNWFTCVVRMPTLRPGVPAFVPVSTLVIIMPCPLNFIPIFPGLSVLLAIVSLSAVLPNGVVPLAIDDAAGLADGFGLSASTNDGSANGFVDVAAHGAGGSADAGMITPSSGRDDREGTDCGAAGAISDWYHLSAST